MTLVPVNKREILDLLSNFHNPLHDLVGNK